MNTNDANIKNYQRANELWRIWDDRASRTGDKHAEYVAGICARWMQLEREFLPIPRLSCRQPPVCTKRNYCPLWPQCDE